jgi:hypothetical protein
MAKSDICEGIMIKMSVGTSESNANDFYNQKDTVEGLLWISRWKRHFESGERWWLALVLFVRNRTRSWVYPVHRGDMEVHLRRRTGLPIVSNVWSSSVLGALDCSKWFSNCEVERGCRSISPADPPRRRISSLNTPHNRIRSPNISSRIRLRTLQSYAKAGQRVRARRQGHESLR